MAIAIDDRPITSEDGLDLDAALNEVAGHLNAQHARLVDLTIELIDNEQRWIEEGLHTIELFLQWRAGLAPPRARVIAAIARRATELPECMTSFRNGELSVDQMAAIVARAPWWTDHEICDLAKLLTIGQLRRTLGQYPFPDIAHPDTPETTAANDTGSEAVEPDTADATAPDDAQALDGDESRRERAAEHLRALGLDPDTPPPPRHLWWGIGDDGVFRLDLHCDPLTGMIIQAAITEARDALFQHGHTDVTDVDALTEVCERSLDTIDTPARRDRFRTNIHLDVHATARDTHGWNLPDTIRNYITCDGLLSPVFIDNSIPISVGRTQRMIPQRTRLIVLLRDQACRVPGCNETHHLEIHHVIHWEDDGTTDTWNLIALCPRHHRMHHRGELGIAGNADTPDGVQFTNRHGRPLGTTGAKPEPPGAPPPAPAGAYQHPLGERLDSRWLYFNPPPEHRTWTWDRHPHNPLRAS
jgi:hypothetical protein